MSGTNQTPPQYGLSPLPTTPRPPVAPVVAAPQPIPEPPPPAPPVPDANARPWETAPIEAPARQPWEDAPIVETNQQPWEAAPIVAAAPNFQNVYQDEELANTAADFFYQQDLDQYNRRLQGGRIQQGAAVEPTRLGPREAIDRFISDRTAQASNSAVAVGELRDVADMPEEQRQRLALMRQRYNALPDFWQEGGRGVRGLGENLMYGALDPVNLAGPVVARGVGALRNRALGALGEIGVTAGVDAVASAGVNVADQAIDNQTGARQGYSATEAGIAGLVGAGASAVGNAAVAGITRSLTPSTGNPILDAQRDGKIGAPEQPEVPLGDRVRSTLDSAQQAVFDRYRPAGDLSRRVDGIDPSAVGLRDAYRGRSPTDADPANTPWIRAQMLAATGGRVEDFILRGGVLPPELNANIANNAYTTGVSPSLLNITQRLDPGQDGNFGVYLMAHRARFIRDVRNPHIIREAQAKERATGIRRGETPAQFQARINDVGQRAAMRTPFDDAQVFLDMGIAKTPQEAAQFAARSIDDWITWGDSQKGFKESKADYRTMMDTALEYQRRLGLVGNTDVDNMAGKQYFNPNNIENLYVPFYPETGNATGNAAKGTPLGAPARAKMEGSTGNKQDFVTSTVSYLHRALSAADRNAFKQSLYDTIEKGVANGTLQRGEIAERVKVDPKALLQQFYADPNADAMLRRAGITSGVQGVAPDDALRVIAMNNWSAGKGTDLVFRNGQVEQWRINDPLTVRMLEQQPGNDFMEGALKIANGFARYRAAGITANPVYASKNFVRDAISSPINSPIGFTILADTLKGATQSIKATQKYRQALADGLGFSSRVDNMRARGALELGVSHNSKNPVDRFYADTLNYMRNTYFNKTLQGWMELSNRVEMASRMGEYMLAKKMGMSNVGAAFMGRQVATDFGQRGTSRELGALMNASSFLSASIQGFYKLSNLLRTDWRRALPLIAAVATIDLAFHAMNSGHPDYQEIPAAIRAQNVILPIYVNDEEGMRWISGEQSEFVWRDGQTRNSPEIDRFIPLPKPFEFGTIGTIANGIADAIATRNPQRAVDAFQTAFVSSIPGVGLPDVVQPVWDLYRNQDWTGRSITPDSMRDGPGITGTQQFTARTPEWAKAASQSLASMMSMFQAEGTERRTLLTPIEIEYLANFAAPGLFNAIPQMATEAMRDNSRTGERPTPRSDEFNPNSPLTWLSRAWNIAAPGRGSESMQRFYDLKTRVDALAQTQSRDYRDFYRVVNVDPNATSEEMQQAVGWSSTLRDGASVLSVLSQEAQIINDDPVMSADAKRAALDANIRMRNETASNLLNLIRTSDFSDRLFATLFNDPRNDRPMPNLARETIRAFRGERE